MLVGGSGGDVLAGRGGADLFVYLDTDAVAADEVAAGGAEDVLDAGQPIVADDAAVGVAAGGEALFQVDQDIVAEKEGAVDAGTAAQIVVVLTAEQGVVAGAAAKLVIALGAAEQVVTAAAVEQVIAAAAREAVGAVLAVEEVLLVVAGNTGPVKYGPF